MAVQSATRTAIILSVQSAATAWGYNMSPAQVSQLVNHIESDINANSGTVLADVIADQAVWPSSDYTRNG